MIPHSPLSHPAGEDEQEQLQCIMEVFGKPPADLLETASRRKLFFDTNMAPRITPNSQGKTRQPSTRTLQVSGRTRLWFRQAETGTALVLGCVGVGGGHGARVCCTVCAGLEQAEVAVTRSPTATLLHSIVA